VIEVAVTTTFVAATLSVAGVAQVPVEKFTFVVPVVVKDDPEMVTKVPPRYVPDDGEMPVGPADTTATHTIIRIRSRKHALKERVPGFFNPFALQSVVISDFLIVIKQPFQF